MNYLFKKKYLNIIYCLSLCSYSSIKAMKPSQYSSSVFNNNYNHSEYLKNNTLKLDDSDKKSSLGGTSFNKKKIIFSPKQEKIFMFKNPPNPSDNSPEFLNFNNDSDQNNNIKKGEKYSEKYSQTGYETCYETKKSVNIFSFSPEKEVSINEELINAASIEEIPINFIKESEIHQSENNAFFRIKPFFNSAKQNFSINKKIISQDIHMQEIKMEKNDQKCLSNNKYDFKLYLQDLNVDTKYINIINNSPKDFCKLCEKRKLSDSPKNFVDLCNKEKFFAHNEPSHFVKKLDDSPSVFEVLSKKQKSSVFKKSYCISENLNDSKKDFDDLYKVKQSFAPKISVTLNDFHKKFDALYEKKKSFVCKNSSCIFKKSKNSPKSFDALYKETKFFTPKESSRFFPKINDFYKSFDIFCKERKSFIRKKSSCVFEKFSDSQKSFDALHKKQKFFIPKKSFCISEKLNDSQKNFDTLCKKRKFLIRKNSSCIFEK